MKDQGGRVDHLLADGEMPLLVTETDIAPDGAFGRSWLAVTDRRVLVLNDDGSDGTPRVELPLSDVRSVRTVHLVGRVALEAETDGRRVELIRGTNAVWAS